MVKELTEVKKVDPLRKKAARKNEFFRKSF